MNWPKFFKSFYYAFRGVKTAYSGQNIKVHTFVAATTIILAFILKISPYDWIIILLLCFMVISLEIVNSSIEKICDFIGKKYSDTTQMRDLAAAAVLVMSICAALIGFLIFSRYLF